MDNLVKIREVSRKYDITARTLRYYEDMGLIQSIRSDDYAYRLYDEEAIKRLEQILILRRLNVSIRDIQLVFKSNRSDVLLEVLQKKVTDIDDEVALLHELKEVVMEFIRQITAFDFQNDQDIKLLYEKVKDIAALVNVDYEGNASPVTRLAEVARRLERMPDIRVVELPRAKAARSGKGNLEAFDAWFSGIKIKHTLSPRDFMWFNQEYNDFEWLYVLSEIEIDTCGFQVFDFPGGLYAVATAIDSEDITRVNRLVHQWVDENEHFEVSTPVNDPETRYDMGHIVTPPLFHQKTGYHLMDLFIPIVVREREQPALSL